jgi:hypothetical protein
MDKIYHAQLQNTYSIFSFYFYNHFSQNNTMKLYKTRQNPRHNNRNREWKSDNVDSYKNENDTSDSNF